MNTEWENDDSLEVFCSQYAERILEMMGRDICKTASALDVDGLRLISLIRRCNDLGRIQERDALHPVDRAMTINSESDAEELRLMPSIIDAFEQKTESVVSIRPRLQDVEWAVLETNVSIC